MVASSWGRQVGPFCGTSAPSLNPVVPFSENPKTLRAYTYVEFPIRRVRDRRTGFAGWRRDHRGARCARSRGARRDRRVWRETDAAVLLRTPSATCVE